jgi:hypothetical protein
MGISLTHVLESLPKGPTITKADNATIARNIFEIYLVAFGVSFLSHLAIGFMLTFFSN